MSRLAWGVWIEMHYPLWERQITSCHASHEACGLKLVVILPEPPFPQSRLAWGVWIEIYMCPQNPYKASVTPRMRRVDWNNNYLIQNWSCIVTPRMRRVDWNGIYRNHLSVRHMSRLAWGVWIEIRQQLLPFPRLHVTPRMRRVDWNTEPKRPIRKNEMSRLAWGVWIEIVVGIAISAVCTVTPRMRRVDWNKP